MGTIRREHDIDQVTGDHDHAVLHIHPAFRYHSAVSATPTLVGWDGVKFRSRNVADASHTHRGCVISITRSRFSTAAFRWRAAPSSAPIAMTRARGLGMETNTGLRDSAAPTVAATPRQVTISEVSEVVPPARGRLCAGHAPQAGGHVFHIDEAQLAIPAADRERQAAGDELEELEH